MESNRPPFDPFAFPVPRVEGEQGDTSNNDHGPPGTMMQSLTESILNGGPSNAPNVTQEDMLRFAASLDFHPFPRGAVEAIYGARRRERDPALRGEVFENEFVVPDLFANITREDTAYLEAALRTPGPAIPQLFQPPPEFVIREALAKRELKAQITVEQLWIAETIAAKELPLDEAKQIHELLTKYQTNPHRLMNWVVEMTKLTNVRKIILTARRFRTKVEHLHEQMDTVSRQNVDNGEWREVADEDGPEYFINSEGLVRMDTPNEWYEASEEIDRQVEQIQTEIKNIEDFVVDHVNKLLYDVQEEKKLSAKLLRKIKNAIEREQLDKAQKESLVDAQEIVQELAVRVFDKVIDFFFYAPPRDIPGIPQFGVTNAHSQRRNRENPNYNAELEEYFNAPEEDEQLT